LRYFVKSNVLPDWTDACVISRRIVLIPRSSGCDSRSTGDARDAVDEDVFVLDRHRDTGGSFGWALPMASTARAAKERGDGDSAHGHAATTYAPSGSGPSTKTPLLPASTGFAP
jgi:hypothetical protein